MSGKNKHSEKRPWYKDPLRATAAGALVLGAGLTTIRGIKSGEGSPEDAGSGVSVPTQPPELQEPGVVSHEKPPSVPARKPQSPSFSQRETIKARDAEIETEELPPLVIELTPEDFDRYNLFISHDGKKLLGSPQDSTGGTREFPYLASTGDEAFQAEREALQRKFLGAIPELEGEHRRKYQTSGAREIPLLPHDRDISIHFENREAEAAKIADIGGGSRAVILEVDIGKENGKNHDWLKQYVAAPAKLADDCNRVLEKNYDAPLAQELVATPAGYEAVQRIIAMTDRAPLRTVIDQGRVEDITKTITTVPDALLDETFTKSFFKKLQSLARHIQKETPEPIEAAVGIAMAASVYPYEELPSLTGKTDLQAIALKLRAAGFSSKEYKTLQDMNMYDLIKIFPIALLPTFTLEELETSWERAKFELQQKNMLITKETTEWLKLGTHPSLPATKPLPLSPEEMETLSKNTDRLFGNGREPGLFDRADFYALCQLSNPTTKALLESLIKQAEALKARITVRDGEVYLTVQLPPSLADRKKTFSQLNNLGNLMQMMSRDMHIPGAPLPDIENNTFSCLGRLGEFSRKHENIYTQIPLPTYGDRWPADVGLAVSETAARELQDKKNIRMPQPNATGIRVFEVVPAEKKAEKAILPGKSR